MWANSLRFLFVPSLFLPQKRYIYIPRGIYGYISIGSVSLKLWLIHLVKGNRWRESVVYLFPDFVQRHLSAAFSGKDQLPLVVCWSSSSFLFKLVVSLPGKTLCDNRQCWLNAHTQGPVTAPLPASLAFFFLSSLWQKDIFVFLSQWQTEASLKTLPTQPGCGFDEKPSNSNERGFFLGRNSSANTRLRQKQQVLPLSKTAKKRDNVAPHDPSASADSVGEGARHWSDADN